MDAATSEMLRNEPGSIGDTARAYAIAFKEAAPSAVTDTLTFNLVLKSILLKREKTNSNNNTVLNLLIPVHDKGIKEIHRLLPELGKWLKYEEYGIDLPTMVLYAMLLESASYRKAFAEMEYSQIKEVLQIVFEEIESICPYQAVLKKAIFVQFNALQSQAFIVQADNSLSVEVMRKIREGNFGPYDKTPDTVKVKPSKPFSEMSGKLERYIQNGWLKSFIYGFSRSHLNTIKVLSLDKTFSIRLDNMAIVYIAAISYYNEGFAKETGEIQEPKKLIEDYRDLATQMSYKVTSHEKTVFNVTHVEKDLVILDFTLFALYVSLVNFKNIRTAIWEDIQSAELVLSPFFDLIYKTSVAEINQSDKIHRPLSFDQWQRIGSNIVSNVCIQSGLVDE